MRHITTRPLAPAQLRLDPHQLSAHLPNRPGTEQPLERDATEFQLLALQLSGQVGHKAKGNAA